MGYAVGKKIFGIIVSFLLFFGVSVAAKVPTVSSLVLKTFKVKVYEFNTATNTFVYRQFGSAVLIKNGVVLTNAHVVLDTENPEKEYFYEICYSKSFSAKPTNCFKGSLINYSEENDLATLRIETKTKADAKFVSLPVKQATKVVVGGQVNALGFQSNGGETITLNKGNINGVEDAYYKTSADISFGSSGGPVFNPKGELVGISTKIVGYYNTMGYFIGIEKVKELMKDTWTNLSYPNELNGSFAKYLIQKATMIKNGRFDNKFVSFKFPTMSTLQFKSLDFDIYKDSMNYIVEDKKDEDSAISISLSKVDGDLTRDWNKEIELANQKAYDALGLYNYIVFTTTGRGNNKLKLANGVFNDGYTLSMLYSMNNDYLLQTVVIGDPKDPLYKQKINYVKNNITLKNYASQPKVLTGLYSIGDLSFEVTGGIIFLKSAGIFQVMFDTDQYNIGILDTPYKIQPSYLKKYPNFIAFKDAWFDESDEYIDGFYSEGSGAYMICANSENKKSLYRTDCSMFLKFDGDVWEYDMVFTYENPNVHKPLINTLIGSMWTTVETDYIW